MDEILKAMAKNASQAASNASQFMLTNNSTNPSTIKFKSYNAQCGRALAKRNNQSLVERDASSNLAVTNKRVAETEGGSFYY